MEREQILHIRALEKLKNMLEETDQTRIQYPCCKQIRDIPNHSVDGEKTTHVACGGCMVRFEIIEEYLCNGMLLPEEIPWSPHYKGDDPY